MPSLLHRDVFVIELAYMVPSSNRRVFSKKYYASGNLLVSDRKTPREGGTILVVA